MPAGNAARAEFIGVQVELAKHEAIRAASGKSGWRTLKLRTQVEALRARESALLAAHGRAWSGEIAGALGVDRFTGPLDLPRIGGGWFSSVRPGADDDPNRAVRWRFERGFVEAVRLPTLAEFIGDRACPHCGTYEWRQRHPNIDGPSWARDCKLCSGFGRVRACPGCDGRGWVYADGTKRVPCVSCGGVDAHLRDGRNGRVFVPAKHGNGWVVPLAPRLARVPGIVTVEIGDRVPDAIGDEVCWLRDREGLADNPAVLPDPIFERLEGGRKEYAGIEWRDEDGVEDVWVVYPSLALATAALALAGGGLLAGLRLPHPEQSA